MKKKYITPRIETVGSNTDPFMELMSYHNAVGTGPQLGKQTDGWDWDSDFDPIDDFDADLNFQKSSPDAPFSNYMSWNN